MLLARPLNVGRSPPSSLPFVLFWLTPTAPLASEASLKSPTSTAHILQNLHSAATAPVLGHGHLRPGFLFGMVIYNRLKILPVHPSMREVSETIYATCKTYLKPRSNSFFSWKSSSARSSSFISDFWPPTKRGNTWTAAAGRDHSPVQPDRHRRQLLGRLVRHPHQHLRQQPHRPGFACAGKPYPLYSIPLQAGMSVGMVLISVELLHDADHSAVHPRRLCRSCFIGFAVGESLGAAALRVAGGIFTKIADIGADLMKIVFNVKEDDARNPGVIADCTGDNAGDCVGPTADGFETYGVTGVALITFILLAVPIPQFRSSFWSGSSPCAWSCC